VLLEPEHQQRTGSYKVRVGLASPPGWPRWASTSSTSSTGRTSLLVVASIVLFGVITAAARLWFRKKQARGGRRVMA